MVHGDTMSKCCVCDATAEPAFSIVHKCGHSTHVDCLWGDPDYKKCATCLGGKSLAVPEPRTSDGIDYVLYPGNKPVPSVLSFLPWIGKRTGDAKPAPLDLLKQHVPIGSIISQHKYGLDHLLREGIDMDDFLMNGYGLDDLFIFEDVSKKGQRRALQVFSNGLGLTANHLRDYPDRLPIEKIRKITGIENDAICTQFGLNFPDNGSLQCCGDTNWDATHCVALGLDMSDLMGFGLYCTEQYDELFRGLTKKQANKAEIDLNTTAAQLDELVSLTPIPKIPPKNVPAPHVVRRETADLKPIEHVPSRTVTKSVDPQRRARFERHGLKDSL